MRFLKLLFAVLAFFTLVAVCAEEKGQDMVVARVNGRLITHRDVEKLLAVSGDMEQLKRRFHGPAFEERKKELFQQALGALILDAVIGVNAQWDEVKLDDADRKRVKEQVRRFTQQYGSEANCELVLSRRGCSIKDARERIAKSMLAEKYIKSKLQVGEFVAPRKVRECFRANTEQLKQITEKQMVIIRQIIVKFGKGRRAKSKASELIEQIKEAACSEEDFGTLARKYSEGPKRDEGGLWEPVSLSDFRENVGQVIAKLDIGEISEPVQRRDDFVLVKLEARADPFEISLRSIIHSVVTERKQEKLQDIMHEIYSNVEVELLLEGVKLDDICPGYSAEQSKNTQEKVEEVSE